MSYLVKKYGSLILMCLMLFLPLSLRAYILWGMFQIKKKTISAFKNIEKRNDR
jgi:hypothetical protein